MTNDYSRHDEELVARYFSAMDRERSGRPYLKREVKEMLRFDEMSSNVARERYRRISGVLEENRILWCTTFQPLPCHAENFAAMVMEVASNRGYQPRLDDAASDEANDALPEEPTFDIRDRPRIDPHGAFPTEGLREFEAAALRILDEFSNRRITLARTQHVLELTFQGSGLVCLITEDNVDLRQPVLEWHHNGERRYKSSTSLVRVKDAESAIEWIYAEWL